jgi:hypothetical protein
MREIKITNPVELKIYNHIIKDMEAKNYSALTNREISEALNVPANTVRDKVIKMNRKGFLLSLINHWDENNKFFIRKILKGKLVV